MGAESLVITPEVNGDVTVTITRQVAPPMTVTLSITVSGSAFCRAAGPIVESYTARHRDGLTDVLPPALEDDVK